MLTVTGFDSTTNLEVISCQVTLTVDTGCDDAIQSITGTAQGLIQDSYSGITQWYTLTDFTTTLASTFCNPVVSYECTGVVNGLISYDSLCDSFMYPAGAGNPGNLPLTATPSDLTNGVYPPGDYIFTIRGFNAANPTDASQSATATFTWQLDDGMNMVAPTPQLQ